MSIPLAVPYRPDPPPEEAKVAAFVFREIVALCFIIFWLVLFAFQLFTGRYEIPFWFHAVAVGVLAYALGLNVAELTSFRTPKEPIPVTFVPQTPQNQPDSPAARPNPVPQPHSGPGISPNRVVKPESGDSGQDSVPKTADSGRFANPSKIDPQTTP